LPHPYLALPHPYLALPHPYGSYEIVCTLAILIPCP